jgi:hypothetical protein
MALTDAYFCGNKCEIKYDHWMDSIDEIINKNQKQNKNEWENHKQITTERRTNEGGAYEPTPTQLPVSFLVAIAACAF